MAQLSDSIAEATGRDCPGLWVTFGCSGEHTSKAEAMRLYDAAQLAFVSGRNAVRFWRTLKQECVYLHDLTDGLTAHCIIKAWMRKYNRVRPHSTLNGDSPELVYERLTAEQAECLWKQAAWQ